VLGEAGWDCGAGGGGVGHKADRRCRSLSRLLLGTAAVRRGLQ
jgi:hypothetical protein